MHKCIDALQVTSIFNLKKHSNMRFLYLGQEKLRRIFHPYEDELSRDVITPFLIVKALNDASSNPNRILEAQSTLKYKKIEMERAKDDLLYCRELPKIPNAVLNGINSRVKGFEEFAYGGWSMQGSGNYFNILKKMSGDRKEQIKAVFEKSAEDVKSAEDLLHDLVKRLADPELDEINRLFPNERLRRLLDKIHRGDY